MMRLRALRLAEVGRFSAPIAVDGFGDGLNVLSGPNELGKSTLLRALEAVLTYEFKSTHSDLRKLVPNGGGAPLIEAEFEADGRLWRVRKQYASSRSASLLDVAAGVVLKNTEAEARLAQLRQGPKDLERFGLLWVRQGESLEAVVPGAMGGGLAALIAGEVDAVSLDARGRTLHAKIRKELLELQTEKTAKPRGAWQAAVQAQDFAAAQLVTAEARVAAQALRLEKLAAAFAARAQLSAPEATAARTDAVATARALHAKALEAHQQRRDAVQVRATALAGLQAAEREDKSLREAVTECVRLATDAANAAVTGTHLRQRRDSITAGLAAARIAVDRESATVLRLESQLKSAQLAARAREAATERDRLGQRIADVRDATVAKDRATVEAAALVTVTEARVKAQRVAVNALASLDAAFAAVAPEVAITLDAAGAGRIKIDGTPLGTSATLHPDAPLTIDIAGVGRITIAPNPAAVSAPRRAEREAKRASVETAFATLGVSTLSEAEARLSTRQDAEARAREAAVRLQALAPHGIDALITQHADFSARASTAGPDAPSVDHTEALLTTSRTARDEAAAMLRSADAADAELREQTARLEAETAARGNRIAALEAQLGDSGAQRTALEAASAKLAAARLDYTTSQSAADAWAANTDADRVDELAAKVHAAELSLAGAETQRAALDQTISGLEGGLRAVSDEDVETELDTARAAAEHMTARLDDIRTEVDALNLLDREFKTIADAGRSELSGPILQRIQPYLARVFPDAALELGDQLVPAQLLRDGLTEAHEQLSRGTQEQIAILVRLGLARLLADRGAAVPLVLDDALVYADDTRISQMFKALQDASRHHQVIVLNCREQTFGALATAAGTTVLQIKPWAPAELALQR